MSIARNKDKFIPTCDICGAELDEYDDFYDAVDAKNAAGWTSQKVDGEWEDSCEECQEA